MHNRGPDNAFVLFGWAIFLAAHHEEDWDDVMELVRRARIADRGGSDPRPRHFLLAELGFYRQAALQLQDGASWHAYALCRQFVYDDIVNTEDAYVRAVEAAPHDAWIVENFERFVVDWKVTKRGWYDPSRGGMLLLTEASDTAQPGDMGAFDTILRHQQQERVREEREREQKLLRLQEEEQLSASAAKVQALWRGYVQRRTDGLTLIWPHSSATTAGESDEWRQVLDGRSSEKVWRHATAGTIRFHTPREVREARSL
eukprot:scaffold1397_cov254-Pinguiococcus_pyrenoidosus.AAC.73